MGILGLKTYASSYLIPYELKSTPLIIDGNAVSINLARLTKCDTRFGGDYKELRQTIFRFFSKLLEDDVTPFVILDGRFKDEKASTLEIRAKQNFSKVQKYNQNHMYMDDLFHIFKTEIFLEELKSLGVFVCRADSEADEEIIALAGKLKIPVLSNDYDFCICENFTFIPWEDEILDNFRFKKFDRERFTREHNVSPSVLPLIPVLVNDDYFKMNILQTLLKRKINIYDALQFLRNKDLDTAKIEIITALNERSFKSITEIEAKINFVIDNYINPKVTLDSTFRKNPKLKSLLADIKFDIQENDIVRKYGVPKKIAELYREAKLPSLMLDMLTHQEFNARVSVIECLDEPSIHSPSRRLLQGICGLLYKDKDEKCPIKLKIRRDGTNIFEDQNSELLHPLIFSETIPLQILYEIMEVTKLEQEVLEFFDGDWSVFILAFIYWKRNCGTSVTPKHFHSALLTAFYLNARKDGNEFPDTIDDRKISKYFRNLKDKDIKNYILRITRDRVFLPDISHIHKYLMLKQCLFYTIHILILLGLPCELKIEEFIDGKLYHSLFYNRENKTPNSYNISKFVGFKNLAKIFF